MLQFPQRFVAVSTQHPLFGLRIRTPFANLNIWATLAISQPFWLECADRQCRPNFPFERTEDEWFWRIRLLRLGSVLP